MITKPGIIYVLRDKFQLHSPMLTSLVEFRFVPEIIRDLDVVNRELLENLIKVFITNNAIPACTLTIIVADNAEFTKDFILPADPKQPVIKDDPVKQAILQEQMKQFLDHVPFDMVASTKIDLPNGSRVIATNKELYDVFKTVFEKQGFLIDFVLPAMVLGENMGNRQGLYPELINVALTKANQFKQYNLLIPTTLHEAEEASEGEEEPLPDYQEKQQTSKPNKKRLILLITVFVVLLAVLIVVILMNQSPPPLPAQKSSSSLLQPQVDNAGLPAGRQATAGVSIIQTPSPSEAPHTENLTVQITDAAGAPQTATLLRNKLSAYKFKTISQETQSTLGATGATITFSPNVSTHTRTMIIGEVKALTSNFIIQERQTALYDIAILLGK